MGVRQTGFGFLAEPETRVTNEESGGQKGAKLTQVGALDPVTLIELARVAGMGANKYSAYNFMKGTDWSLMFNAMMRHALRFWAGEDEDPESKQLHMAHAAWMALALVSFSRRGLGNDDRPPSLEPDAEAAAVDLLGSEWVERPAERHGCQRNGKPEGEHYAGCPRLETWDEAGQGNMADFIKAWESLRDASPDPLLMVLPPQPFETAEARRYRTGSYAFPGAIVCETWGDGEGDIYGMDREVWVRYGS